MKGMAAFASRIAVVAAFIVPLAGCWNNSRGDHDVDLASAVWLSAEPVPTVAPEDTADIDGDAPVSALFSYAPGTWKSLSSYSGVIDPVGTSIANDFDGDGILNANETATSIWVADYPVIAAQVATPVTMKVKILLSRNSISEEIVSEINSEDMESARNKGSEKIHQSELNLRTVQFQDSFSNSDEASRSTQTSVSASYSGSLPLIGGSVGMSYSTSVSNSWSAKVARAGTVTKWADKPFKNNLDRDASTLKSEEAAKNAHKYRTERLSKVDENSKIEPNAGYVRAALYIKNESVNMPVRMRNILCSLMFETPEGTLIPVQSFRLRNDDYSLFEVDVYGGEEFGPYVVELNNLNTAEIERAIAMGYVPKVFLVDYEMVHVADSNYRSMLLNFSGDNLKIVEENAKGRTALVKVVGPGIREMYRIAAFSVNGSGDVCNPGTVTSASPGVPLRTLLERAACTGLEIEFDEVVVDLGEVFSKLDKSRLHLKTVKSIGGIETKIPCEDKTETGSDGVARTACVMKSFDTWSVDEKKSSGAWVIFSKGKYYNQTGYVKDGTNTRKFDPSSGYKAADMVLGLDATAWVGDYYDIVYISYEEIVEAAQEFGNNPLEASKQFDLQTGWDLQTLGANPFDPDNGSVFLGEAGFGETVEIKIKLDSTWFLNPQFLNPVSDGAAEVITDFAYSGADSSRRFDLNQAVDFEISMGFGGQRTDWLHVLKDIDANDPLKLSNCGRSVDYVKQEFTLCVKLPTEHPVVSGDSLIKLYLRPSLNSAYRNTVWPLSFNEVRRFQGTVDTEVAAGGTTVYLKPIAGATPGAGDMLYFTGSSIGYNVLSSSVDVNGVVRVNLASGVSGKQPRSTVAYVKANLSEPDVKLVIDNGFLQDWNTENTTRPAYSTWDVPAKLPLQGYSLPTCSGDDLMHVSRCLGFDVETRALNWLGSYNYGVPGWNSWSDGGNFTEYLDNGLPYLSNASQTAMRFEGYRSDFVVQNAGNVDPVTDVQTVAYGQKALTIWRQGSTVRGRWIDLSQEDVTGDEILISAADTVNSKPVIVSSGSTAAVVWAAEVSASTEEVHVTTINLSTEVVGSPARVNVGDIANVYYPTQVAAAISNNRLVIGWVYSRRPSGFAFGARARVIDLTTALPIGTVDTSLYSSTNSSAYRMDEVAVAANGTHAIVAFTRNIGSTYLLLEHVVNLQSSPNPAVVAAMRTVANPSGQKMNRLRAYAGDQYGWVMWQNEYTKSVQGRAVDLSQNILMGTVNHSLDSGSIHAGIELAGNGNQILAMFGSSQSLKGRWINLANPVSPLGSSITMSTTRTSVVIPGAITYADGHFLYAWTGSQNGFSMVRGRSISSGTTLFESDRDILISTTGTNNGTPSVAVSGDQVVFVWVSLQGSQSIVRARTFNIYDPNPYKMGLNNFFVSPLLRRTYTIESRIKY
jgi:hypothetical protein